MGRTKGSRNKALLNPHPLAQTKRVLINLPQWLIDWTAEQPESRNQLIEYALSKTYDLEPPILKPPNSILKSKD